MSNKKNDMLIIRQLIELKLQKVSHKSITKQLGISRTTSFTMSGSLKQAVLAGNN